MNNLQVNPSLSCAIAVKFTNISKLVNFTAIAQDKDGLTWRLFICNTSTFSAGACGGLQFCNSSYVASNARTSCTINTSSYSSLEKYNWYAFAWDGTQASSYSNTSSPFQVNHYPSAPTGGAPTSGHNRSVILSWTKIGRASC